MSVLRYKDSVVLANPSYLGSVKILQQRRKRISFLATKKETSYSKASQTRCWSAHGIH